MFFNTKPKAVRIFFRGITVAAKRNEASKRLKWILVTLIGCVILDQLTKWIAIAWLKNQPPIIFPGNLFRFQYAENPGAFLSLGSQLSDSTRFWVFTVSVGAVLLACLYFLIKERQGDFFQTLAFSLLIGGGFSNLLDRIFRNEGRVVDFMNMGIGNLRTGIFNIADMAIMAGIGIILVRIPLSPEDAKRK